MLSLKPLGEDNFFPLVLRQDRKKLGENPNKWDEEVGENFLSPELLLPYLIKEKTPDGRKPLQWSWKPQQPEAPSQPEGKVRVWHDKAWRKHFLGNT